MGNYQDKRDLTDVFAELQQARISQNKSKTKLKTPKRKKQATINGQASQFPSFKLVHFTYFAPALRVFRRLSVKKVPTPSNKCMNV